MGGSEQGMVWVPLPPPMDGQGVCGGRVVRKDAKGCEKARGGGGEGVG